MNPEVAKKLMRMTQEGYGKISDPFAQTRQYMWRDFKLFEPFVKGGASVLDIGCGSGRAYAFLKGRIGSYVGVDSNRHFINHCNENYGADDIHPRFIHGNMVQLDNVPELALLCFAEQKLGGFDCVLSIAALHHIPSRALQLSALEQMNKYLKPSGVLILLNWNFWQLSAKKKSFWKYTRARIRTSNTDWKKKFGIDKNEIGYKDMLTLWTWGNEQAPLYYYSFCCAELSSLVRKAGLSIIKNSYIFNDTDAHWWSGKNILTIAQKE